MLCAFSSDARPHCDIVSDRSQPVHLDGVDVFEFVFQSLSRPPSETSLELFENILRHATIPQESFHDLIFAGHLASLQRENQDRDLWMTLLRVYNELAIELHIPETEVVRGYMYFLTRGPCFDDKIRMLQDSGVDLSKQYVTVLSTCIAEDALDVAKKLVKAGVPKKFAYKQHLLRNPKYRNALLTVMM